MKATILGTVAVIVCGVGATGCEPSLAETCCHAISASGLRMNTLLPDDTLYDVRIESYWSVSAALHPWCMVLPSTTKDVSNIITTLVRHQCPFGIRSGGHSGFALANSVRDGVTIDFGHMNTTTYNSTTNLASIEPGALWQDVYASLAPHGVVVTGGRTGSVGVGGFLTGGGNSFHSSSHGMGCDTVANFEVALANGSIINANSEENSDLWVALKGGSANFGLVTRFDLHAIAYPDPAAPNIWVKFLSYNVSVGDGVIEAMTNFTENGHRDQNTTSILYFGHVPAAGGMVLHLGLENTAAVIDPPAAKEYIDVGSILSTTEGVLPMTELTASENPAQAAGFRNIWFTLSFANDARVMKYAAKQHEQAVQKLLQIMPPDKFHTMCAFQPLNKIVADHGVRNGGNVMGLDYWMRDGDNGIMFLAEVGLRGAEAEEQAFPIMREWVGAVEAYATKLGVSWNWKYLNYAAMEQDPLSTIGPQALEKIRVVAAKYDPSGIFQTLRASGLKIPIA